MPKFKITEYRTTPTVYTIEAKDADEAQEVFDNRDYDEGVACKLTEIGRNDDINVETDIEELVDGEEVIVEYPTERT